MIDQQPITPQKSGEQSVETITLHDLIQLFFVNWRWFLLSTICCLGLAYFYLAQTPRIYKRDAVLLIKDTRKGGDIEIGAFSDLAGFQSRRSVDNELYIIQSRRLMMEVVRELNLTTNYTTKRGLRTYDLYKKSPVSVEFINHDDKHAMNLSVTPQANGTVILSDFEDNYLERSAKRTKITASYGDTVSTPLGRMVVIPTVHLDSTYYDHEVRVTKRSEDAVANAYRKQVKSQIVNKQASVVAITMNSSSPRRAEDVLNTLISVYNADAIKDKQSISKITAEFIAARLEVIGQELGEVDRNIADIKQSNRIIDLHSEAQRTATESSRYKAESLSLENQITVAEYIRQYLQDATHQHELIPMVASIQNQGITSQIADYNEAVLRRQKLLENSSENNPIIQEITHALTATRHSIIASLNSHISTLDMQRDAMRSEEQSINRRITNMPSQEKVILDIARQQKIKEELFLYLLNKQEETQLNFVVAESNSRIIDLAYGSNTPISPRPVLLFALALIVGLAIPFGLFFLIGILDTTIRGRRDVEKYTSIPFLGDIPSAESGSVSRQGVAVRETGRDAVSEAFRLLRSNMAFMNISSEKEIQTILFTSSNPHAGKTFVATNLAMTLAMAGKRVLVIDLDLRRHAFSSQMGHGHTKRGVTSYLSGGATIEAIIEASGLHDSLDVIYAGIQPPNPAEMLLSKQLDHLFDELRKRYDYIFIDCTPSMSVADALICDRLADLTIYVVREGILDRRQLPDIERLYREKKFHNMSIVLNDTKSHRHGYGYGYGYGDTEPQEVGFRQRIARLFNHKK